MMPRYYFNLYNDTVIYDRDGEDLPDMEAARKEAVEAVRAMICHYVRKGHLNLAHRIEVTDEQGKCVIALPFRNAFTISG